MYNLIKLKLCFLNAHSNVIFLSEGMPSFLNNHRFLHYLIEKKSLTLSEHGN